MLLFSVKSWRTILSLRRKNYGFNSGMCNSASILNGGKQTENYSCLTNKQGTNSAK